MEIVINSYHVTKVLTLSTRKLRFPIMNVLGDWKESCMFQNIYSLIKEILKNN